MKKIIIDYCSTITYISKKLLTFFLLYFISAIIGEILVIGLLFAFGYHPLQGIMPTSLIGTLLPYYGFCVFLFTTILYCRYIEKLDLRSLGFGKKKWDFFVGGIIAVILLAMIIGVCCHADTMSFSVTNQKTNIAYLIALFIGFIIQSTAEETLCRGFLLQSLLKKTSTPTAILVSASAFAMPHFASLFETEFTYAIIGVINLYLISILLSVLILYHHNLWIACGLHSVWNFILYGIFGLTLSGNDSNIEGVFSFKMHSMNLLNGGIYGIEASIITTTILSIAIFIFIKYGQKRS